MRDELPYASFILDHAVDRKLWGPRIVENEIWRGFPRSFVNCGAVPNG
jgi:hypothetical protein